MIVGFISTVILLLLAVIVMQVAVLRRQGTFLKGQPMNDDLALAFHKLRNYFGDDLSTRVTVLEHHFSGGKLETLDDLLGRKKLTADLLHSARPIKRATGQIHVVIHALGILLSLPSVLEKGEIIEQLSSGLATRPAVTTIWIFTFIDWKGRDSARQDKLFKDFFLLAEADTQKKRCLYVNSRDGAIKCLSGGRLCKSLLGRNALTGSRFTTQYPDTMRVCDYFRQRESLIAIIQLENTTFLSASE